MYKNAYELLKAVNARKAAEAKKAAEEISYQPAGTIGGSQSIAAHTHSITLTDNTDASVTVTGHTHTVTLSGASVNA